MLQSLAKIVGDLNLITLFSLIKVVSWSVTLENTWKMFIITFDRCDHLIGGFIFYARSEHVKTDRCNFSFFLANRSYGLNHCSSRMATFAVPMTTYAAMDFQRKNFHRTNRHRTGEHFYSSCSQLKLTGHTHRREWRGQGLERDTTKDRRKTTVETNER